jgi:hypothetical protein
MFNKISIILISIIIVNEIKIIYGSIGDRLPVYRNCLNECLQNNCSNSDAIELFNKRQPNYLLLIGWDCSQECQHHCQWVTIRTLVDSGLHYKHLPQFYGKVSLNSSFIYLLNFLNFFEFFFF